MNTYWKDVPCLRLIIPLIVGILIYFFLPSSSWLLALLCFIILSISVCLFNFLPDFTKLKLAFVKGILLQCILISAGYFLCVIHTISSSKNWYKHNVAGYEYALVQLTEEPQSKAKTIKATVEIIQLLQKEKKIQTQGDAFVYFQKSESAMQLKQGDIILVKNIFKDIKANGNPGEFNYAAYCKSKNIFQSAFLKEHEWQQTSLHRENRSSFFSQAGKQTRSILKKNMKDSVSIGIAEALLIGYRNNIDNEVWQAYSNTGIVHIIAISGMHMAMIYVSVRWLLFLIPFMRKKRMLSLSIAILFMWMFACMTGLPPSVTRAAIMFTFLGIGEMVDRDISGLNNLAASAFSLLCINPFWLQDVGFQLSYLAVLSLLLFYSKVYHWIYISNRYLDAVWKLIAGTIAAQILTFPLCVYYFHQFPWLFLLTNLIAVPATTIILYAEIILVAFSWIKPFALFLGSCISHAITWLNTAVFFISKLSFAVWSGLQINMLQTIILFVIVMLFSVWLIKRKMMYLPWALGSVLLLACSFTFDRMNTLKRHTFIVYNAPKQKAIEFMNGETYFSPDTDSLLLNANAKRFLLQPSHLFFGVQEENKSIVQIKSSESLDLFLFEKKKIARIKRSNFNLPQAIQVDYVILSEQCKPDIHWLNSNFNTTEIIIDSSIPFWKTEEFKVNLSALKIPIHCVNEDGAFVVGL